ncbi:MAG: hypothetical protein EOM37_04095 [Proteobacteria bacterium]|jgi:hypothetical protein|nr:hypothetical protein [Alphaproteobacteria bacterium]NCC03215.1 hypothetical protein [Pseudomonadota bacterium]
MQNNITEIKETETQGHSSDIEEQIKLLRIEIKLGLTRRATKRLGALTARLTELGSPAVGSDQTIIAKKSYPQAKDTVNQIP